MLREANFWNSERSAPILNLNQGFLQSQGEAIFTKVTPWLAMVGCDKDKEFELHHVDEPKRLIMMDAIRTFVDKAHQQQLINVLSCCANQLKSYHQALSYVTGFLLLVFPASVTVNVIKHLDSDPKYISGYWNPMTVSYAVDAYIFQNLVEMYFAEVETHFKALKIQPETYTEKWFVALCVHVLPFENLYEFFEQFLLKGKIFLFQFGLALIENLKEQLLDAKGTAKIFEYLRLDSSLTIKKEVITRILLDANKYDLKNIDFKLLEKQLYATKLQSRIEEAQKQLEAEPLDPESEDDGLECSLCKDNVPEYYCSSCKNLMCEICHKKKIGAHTNLHQVIEVDINSDDILALTLESKLNI